ncbi:MAG: M20/M25/M40 family metallo-hydrolase [Clostridia bacterium]|nr:M20/M25/M40 family metallo-hydrolase [Clostridia bacterium]
MMNDKAAALAEGARIALASMPELAFEEEKTKAYIKAFLAEHTTLEVHDEGAFLYAAHREGSNTAIAVRADFDAVPTETGAKHLCGHNGHTAALLALALLLEGNKVGGDVILLFQPAEETGAGAPACAELFRKERIDSIIGAHNIPGEPLGKLILRHGVFACASCGLEIAMTGSPAHAAYPENGVDPTKPLAELALSIPDRAAELTREYGCMTLATVVGMRTGEKAFGVAASEGRLWVTLRSEDPGAFAKLVDFAKSDARARASDARAKVAFAEYDPFPATVNDEGLVNRAEAVCLSEKLPYKYASVPFRWSEDFGHYGAYAPSLFFGIGSGECTPPLHTASYCYPEGLAPIAARIFLKLVRGLR